MTRALAIAAIGFALAGCAQNSVVAPSYLGLSDAAASDDDDADALANDGVEPALRRIPSNKVLSALAFQKVTGRAVDPSRLSGKR
ncbi:MAG: hypothetical protein ACT4OU_10420 [Hyphomicrobium sp.]